MCTIRNKNGWLGSDLSEGSVVWPALLLETLPAIRGLQAQSV